jgi:hypothetical protein
VLHGGCGEPVKDALLAGELGKQHHAGEEEIDVVPFDDGGERTVNGKQPREQQQSHAQGNPPGFADVLRTPQHERQAGRNNAAQQHQLAMA